MTKIQTGRRLFEKSVGLYIDKKRKTHIKKKIPTSLKVTISRALT